MSSHESHSSFVVSLKNTKMKLLVVILFLCASAHGYKILGVFPFSSKSHYAIGEATMRALAEVGHDVTMVSVYEKKNPLPNFKEIIVTDAMEKMQMSKINVNWSGQGLRLPNKVSPERIRLLID